MALTDAELGVLSIAELDVLLEDLDKQRLAIRHTAERVKSVRNMKLRTEHVLHKLGNLKPADVAIARAALASKPQTAKANAVEVGVASTM